MTFETLFLILALGSYWLESSHASSTVGGPAAYTTITNRIDIMGAVAEFTQENNSRGYRGGRNVYSINDQDSKTHTEIEDTNYHDVPRNPKTAPENLNKIPGISDFGPPVSYVVASSGPSIRISTSTAEYGPRIISYSAPGRVFVSQGTPAGSSLKHPSSIIDPITASFPASKPVDVLVQTDNSPYAGYAGLGHPAYAAAYRNLEAARQIVAGIPSAVSRALNNYSRGIHAVYNIQ